MKNNLRKIAFSICIVICVSCVGYLLWYFWENRADKETENTEKKVQEAVQKSQDKLDIPVDFEELREKNPDVYAWISIPGTEVNYPVVQSLTDDEYYLDHLWDGSSGAAGAIFTQACNRKDFTDFNTVIYGHVMGDGTMFNGLHQYMDPEYWEDHSEITVYTPDHVRTYRIFAAVVYDDRHIMDSFRFQEEAQCQAFLDSLAESRDLRNQYDSAVKVTPDDRIITLSTCISGERHHRYLVGAVLTDEK